MTSHERPDEDWTQITDPNLRRRIQNRLAQRTWRAKRQRSQAMTEDAADFSPSQTAESTLPDASQSPSSGTWQSLQFLDPDDQGIIGSSYRPTETFNPAASIPSLWQDSRQTESIDAILAGPSTHDDNESLDSSMKTRETFLRSGNTALHEAALHGHNTVVRRLLKRGANIDSRNSLGNTALHLAAGNGHQTVVSLLVEQQSDVDLKNRDGQTALHLAAASGQDEVIELLLNQRAKIDLTRD